jgi:ribonuclease P protein component
VPALQSRAITRLKRHPEFLRVAKSKRKWVARGLILQARNSISSGRVEDDAAEVRAKFRVGFTVSKKVGNAVKRNRARRRLREAARQVMLVHAKPGFDYVIIGRYATLARQFDGLLSDLETALEKTGCHS